MIPEQLTELKRLVKIWHPENPPMYLRESKALRKEAQGKYIVRIEDPCMPAKGWWKRIKYRYKHEMEKALEHDILMSVCPYSVGDIVELSVVKVLIPSGFFTTETDRI